MDGFELKVGPLQPAHLGKLSRLTATALMTALAMVHYNLRIVRKWARSTGFHSDDILLGRDPKVEGYEAVPIDETPHGAIDPPRAA